MLEIDQQHDLLDLHWHWGSAYDVAVVDGTWSARYRGTDDELTAGTATELRQAIRADYGKRKGGGGWRPECAAHSAPSPDSYH